MIRGVAGVVADCPGFAGVVVPPQGDHVVVADRGKVVAVRAGPSPYLARLGVQSDELDTIGLIEERSVGQESDPPAVMGPYDVVLRRVAQIEDPGDPDWRALTPHQHEFPLSGVGVYGTDRSLSLRGGWARGRDPIVIRR